MVGKKPKEIFCDLKIDEIQMSVSINKVLLEHSHVIYILSMTTLATMVEVSSGDRDHMVCRD